MENVIFEVKKDVDNLLVVSINNEVAWEVEQEFKDQLLQYLRSHIGNGEEYADEFDPLILEAIDKIETCVKGSELGVD